MSVTGKTLHEEEKQGLSFKIRLLEQVEQDDAKQAPRIIYLVCNNINVALEATHMTVDTNISKLPKCATAAWFCIIINKLFY